MNIHNLIQTIRRRPGMFLGSLSIKPLMHFINGYKFAQNELGKNNDSEIFPLDFWFFHEFVKVKLGFSSSVPGWCNLILQSCNGDEKKALEMFFTLYDEFEQIRPVKYWKAVLTAENIEYNNSCRHCYRMTGTDINNHDEREPIYDKPLAVYITELELVGKTAYLLVTETENAIEAEHWFYNSFEQAASNDCIPESAETYFGKIDNWTEFPEPPEFSKKVKKESPQIQVTVF